MLTKHFFSVSSPTDPSLPKRLETLIRNSNLITLLTRIQLDTENYIFFLRSMHDISSLSEDLKRTPLIQNSNWFRPRSNLNFWDRQKPFHIEKPWQEMRTAYLKPDTEDINSIVILDASVRPSVRPSVRRSVRRFVGPSVGRSVGNAFFLDRGLQLQTA